MKIKIVFWAIFGLLIFVSAWLRIGIPYDDIVKEDMVRFSSVDAYYHMMLADYTYENWPDVQQRTTLLLWPDGSHMGARPLNGWLMGTIAKFGGFAVDSVGAYWPAILGVLTLIPVLMIGWLVWGRWAGLIGVGLLATIQGEFLGRTSLGFADQHALEVFLSVTIVLFLILALKRHWLWAFGGGFCLGLHLLNWAGAPLLTILIMAFLGVWAIRNHWKGLPNRDLCLSAFIIFGLSFVMFALFKWNVQTYILSLGIVAFVPLVLYGISKAMARFKPFWYLVALCCVAVVGVAALRLAFPSLVDGAFRELGRLMGEVGNPELSAGRTISEVQPLLAPGGKFTMVLVWGGYGLVFFVGLIGLVLLGFKASRPEAILVFVWCLGMLLVTLMQRRFGYYLAVNLCLLSGYLCWATMSKLGWQRRRKKEAKRKGLAEWHFSKSIVVIGVVIILLFMAIPNLMSSTKEAQQHPYAMSPAWIEATDFIRTETPQTGDYGVLSWWDYGYWIAREGERPVPCHPGGGKAKKLAQFFTAQSTEEAEIIADSFKCEYVVIDYQMVTSKFYAIPILAEYEGFTDANYNDSMVCRLFFSEDGIGGYREVFESKAQYEGHSQVKVYERY